MTRPLLPLALLVLLVGCPSGDDDDTHSAGVALCDLDDRDEEYVPGMAKEGEEGSIHFLLVETDPGPPDVGACDWLVELSALADDAALAGCTVTADPFMPDHGHGADLGAGTEQAEPGTYLVTGQRFSMSGYWEITMEADCPDAGVDRVLYRFCIEG